MAKKRQENAIVVKSNDLVEARYDLTLTEQRVILYMVAMIEPDDVDFKTYRITVSEFVEIMGIDEKTAYNQIRQVTNSLREKALNIYNPQEDSFLNVGWLSSSKYFKGKGYVELRFDPALKFYLLGLKQRFTSYKFTAVARLNSSYSIRIYELLKQYHKIGVRNFTTKELRSILGIEDKEYPLYANFKAKVILVAQSELAKSTDLSFTFEETKSGRKVTGIEFTITVKQPIEAKTAPATELINVTPAKERPVAEIASEITALVDLLPLEHRGKKTLIDTITTSCKKHCNEYVAYNIRYANANCKEKTKYRSYLNKALKENWGESLREDVEAAKIQATVKKQEVKKKEDTDRHDKELYDRAIEYIGKLKAKDKKKLEAEALASFTPDMQAKYKAGDFFVVKGVKGVMEGIVMERLAGYEKKDK
ncbi:MAG: replication initiation protein [Nitrospirae bacterium]|nr:replication initiation protein [Nitrospirota bacterium]